MSVIYGLALILMVIIIPAAVMNGGRQSMNREFHKIGTQQ